MKLYLVGSLRNKQVPEVADELRRLGHEVFDNWFAAGPEADDNWQAYHIRQGHGYVEALKSPEARHVFEFDKRWLDWCEGAVMLLPAGRSAWGELMWTVGRGKPGWILVGEQPERFDVMAQFATGVYEDIRELGEAIEQASRPIYHDYDDWADYLTSARGGGLASSGRTQRNIR